MKLRAMHAAALGMALFSGGLSAEEAKKPAWYETITISGYVDAYYQYNLNGRSAPSAPMGRAFDVTQQQFSFSGAKLSLTKSDSESGTSGTFDLLYGPVAKLVNATSPNESLAVEQAFLAQTFGPLTLKMGKFTTWLGTELIETPSNMNYSHSVLFGQIPFYHVGLSATYVPVEGTSIMLYTGNGNSVDSAGSEYRDWGASLGYSKIAGLSLIGNYYMESSNVGLVYENMHYFQFLASYAITDTLSSSAEYLYKTRIASKDTDSTGMLIGSTQPDPSDPAKPLPYSPKNQGYALYLKYQTPIANLLVLPRFGQWYNPEGTSTLITDTTITLKYLAGPLTHYLEYRNDWMNLGGYVGAGGADPAVIVYNQNTLTYGATFTF